MIVPFPRHRNRRFVRRHAARMAELSPVTAEKHLRHQLSIQVETMLKRGIDPDAVERERRSLETAIRAELWHLVLMPGGAG
jgi:hypothetical protein